MSGKYRFWKPFEKANAFRGGIAGLSPEDFIPDHATREVWINNLYQVEVLKFYDGKPVNGMDYLQSQIEKRPLGTCAFIRLSFKRQDGTAVHDWRDCQRIKNELVGEDWTGIEIYPPESILVDTCNQWFLFCVPDGEARFPFMFQERLVTEAPNGPYGSQRPWPKNEKPPDLKTADELAAMLDKVREAKGTQ